MVTELLYMEGEPEVDTASVGVANADAALADKERSRKQDKVK
jgi:hypothetical protein